MINQRSTLRLREYWGGRIKKDGIKGCRIDFIDDGEYKEWDTLFVPFDTLCRCNHKVGDHLVWNTVERSRRCGIYDCNCMHPKEKTFEYMIRGLG